MLGASPISIDSQDVLLVIDLQADFMPGGTLAVDQVYLLDASTLKRAATSWKVPSLLVHSIESEADARYSVLYELSASALSQVTPALRPVTGIVDESFCPVVIFAPGSESETAEKLTLALKGTLGARL